MYKLLFFIISIISLEDCLIGSYTTKNQRTLKKPQKPVNKGLFEEHVRKLLEFGEGKKNNIKKPIEQKAVQIEREKNRKEQKRKAPYQHKNNPPTMWENAQKNKDRPLPAPSHDYTEAQRKYPIYPRQARSHRQQQNVQIGGKNMNRIV